MRSSAKYGLIHVIIDPSPLEFTMLPDLLEIVLICLFTKKQQDIDEWLYLVKKYLESARTNEKVADDMNKTVSLTSIAESQK